MRMNKLKNTFYHRMHFMEFCLCAAPVNRRPLYF